MEQNISQIERSALPALAACIHMCAPEVALKRVCTSEMREGYEAVPGVLFRFGSLRFPGERTQLYQGGLTEHHHLFVLVPHQLVERARRANLHQLAHERLVAPTMQALRSYCRLAEAELLAQRTFFHQVIRERLGLTHPTHLLVACTLVERLLVQDEDYARACPALVADLRAREIRTWYRLLASRQEVALPDWQW